MYPSPDDEPFHCPQCRGGNIRPRAVALLPRTEEWRRTGCGGPGVGLWNT